MTVNYAQFQMINGLAEKNIHIFHNFPSIFFPKKKGIGIKRESALVATKKMQGVFTS